MKELLKKKSKPTLPNKTTDWQSFRAELTNRINLKVRLKTKLQLEIEAEKFINVVQSAAWNNTKEYTHRTVGNNYPMEIRETVKEKKS